MSIKIKEPITVAAIFDKSPLLKPVWFIWHGRKYGSLRTTYSWMEKNGHEERVHFSVSDGANLYELCYNTRRLFWQIVAVEEEV